MKIGTKSLLFGVHQFLWHPWTVARAWRKLYGRWPTWQESVCIFVHDWGYWGKPNMDGPEGREHPWAGAKIAMRTICWVYQTFPFVNKTLSPVNYHYQTLLHSRHLARKLREAPSRLCWADKYCVWTEPMWFYWLRATLSGELKEYRANHESRTGKISSWEWIEYYRKCVIGYDEIFDLLTSPSYKRFLFGSRSVRN